MTIAFKQDNVITEIGPGGILHSLCSTIACRLEGGNWGEKYPLVMNKFYRGYLSEEDAAEALTEMYAIRSRLTEIPAAEVIWDFDDQTILPPWGKEIGNHVKNIYSYYVTTSGRNLVDEIIDNMEALAEFGGTLEVISYNGAPPVL